MLSKKSRGLQILQAAGFYFFSAEIRIAEQNGVPLPQHPHKVEYPHKERAGDNGKHGKHNPHHVVFYNAVHNAANAVKNFKYGYAQYHFGKQGKPVYRLDIIKLQIFNKEWKYDLV